MGNYGSITREDVLLSPNEDYTKYQDTSLKGGKRYARITYIGGEICPEQTYIQSYCSKNGLGKYAKSGSSSKSSSSPSSRKGFGLGAAVGGGMVGLAKKAFEESPEEKAERKREEREDERIENMVEHKMKRFKRDIKEAYPLTGTTDELVQRVEELMNQAEECKLDESHPNKLHARLAEEKKKATAWLAFKLCKRVKKQDAERAAQPDMKAWRRKASRYSQRTLIICIALFMISMLLFIIIASSVK